MSDLENRDGLGGNLSALTAVADAELTSAAGRNSSFEARALGMFTLIFAVPTLYLVLREPLGLAAKSGEAIPAAALWVGAGAAVLALVAAIVVAWPVKVAVVGKRRIIELHKQADQGVWMEGLLLRDRMAALERLHARNRSKGVALIFSLLLTTVTLVAFGVAAFCALP